MVVWLLEIIWTTQSNALLTFRQAEYSWFEYWNCISTLIFLYYLRTQFSVIMNFVNYCSRPLFCGIMVLACPDSLVPSSYSCWMKIISKVIKSFCRLFYAGAAQGQLPGMLTMVTSRATPAPAVLAVAFLSLLYLTVSDIYALINYVGFATWVSHYYFNNISTISMCDLIWISLLWLSSSSTSFIKLSCNSFS